MKKYEAIKVGNYYRIKALKDFQLITGEVVRKGDLGGLVYGEHNLSKEGNCWIEFEARAFGKSRVMDNAVLKDCSVARDNSIVSGNAVMKDNSRSKNNSKVSENAVLKDQSEACDNSTISGNAILTDFSCAFNNSIVSGNAVMKDYSWAKGDSIITGNALLQADQHIQFGTVTTDLLGTKDWIGALYAELGVKPKHNKVVLYKKAWSTDDKNVFKSDYDRNFLYKIGETVVAENVDEDIFKPCTNGLHFTNLENLINYDGDTIIECEIDVDDVVTVQFSMARVRKCRVLKKFIRVILK